MAYFSDDSGAVGPSWLVGLWSLFNYRSRSADVSLINDGPDLFMIKESAFFLVPAAGFKGPILYCFSSISHSCQRSSNSVFDMHCPKHIHGPELQLSKSCSAELCSEHSVSVPAPLNANGYVVSTHIQTNTNCSRHVVVKNETLPRSLLLFCSWDRI